ncbi:CmcJ/NvfI family oxidoreductase [Chelatococcus reniformis]|uniref:Methyltransferase n=1 Tax=Chelatococcus reniformis TaxID=1494448 RepID=A0A916TY45_9HYPH|nr:CmcJ/NvfI family oxidoreductase [Chelatococcus reniformis]GGC49373.1 methyltransferase [Chelatococcus reniformis]
MYIDGVGSGPARSVTAELNFIQPTGEKPRNYTFQPPGGDPGPNYGNEAHAVEIRDLRGRETDPTLDREGFAVVRHASVEREFTEDSVTHGPYYGESEALLRAATGADRVFIFDHTIRRHIPGSPDRRADGPRQPVTRVHVDQTPKSGAARVFLHLGDEAQALSRGRVRIVNLWRPIRGPVLDRPLAVADARSVAADDLVPTDLIYPDRVGETYSVKFNPAQAWFYVSAMQPDEVLLLKCYDSAVDGRARFAPHTAFIAPDIPAVAKPRESIEIRALVFGG